MRWSATASASAIVGILSRASTAWVVGAAVVLCGVASESVHAADCPVATRPNAQGDTARYLDDVTSGDRWAIIPDCEHPQWPARLVELPLVATSAGMNKKLPIQLARPEHKVPQILVRSGSHVMLWRESENTRVSLDAIALESGALGSYISLRLARGGAVLSGMVRGSGSAELQSTDRTRRLP